jgi:GNAT superfamily N-acetyltransferase
MIALTASATLHPLVLPARADAADADDLISYARVRNASLIETTGRDDELLDPVALLPLLRSDTDATRRQWLIRDGEETIGLGVLNILADDDGRTAFVTINILERFWGRGLGSAALARIEQVAADAGVRKLLLWTQHTDHGEPHLDSPTGFGSVPQDHHARFLIRHGFVLEQVDRVSVLEFDDGSMSALAALRDEAQRLASDYRVVQWMLPTPPEHIARYAWMKEHMSTDAPDAGMGMPAESWDAERIARHDARHLDRGNTVLVTAAEHVATGELCAYNELAIGSRPDETTHQEDTLVLSAHRGHRLGMLVKTAGLLTWTQQHPLSPRVITFNAEENRPMLNINEAMGFTPIAYEGAWRKDLS